MVMMVIIIKHEDAPLDMVVAHDRPITWPTMFGH